MEKDPRYTAVHILTQWDSAGQHTLDQILHANQEKIDALSIKDRRLFNAIVFGVLRHRAALDWILDACSNTPVKKIQKDLIYIFRSALFQIIYLDRVPDFAAIDTAVSIASKTNGKKAGGFVNAVLRKAAKTHTTINLPDIKKQPALSLSVTFSMPLWLTQKWLKAYGEQKTRALLEQIQSVPAITIRTNTLKATREELAQHLEKDVENLRSVADSDITLEFDSPKLPIDQMETFKNGWFQIQDPAAQLVTRMLDPQPGERILDACAGLGGKTGHIAQEMQNKGQIIACDMEASKLSVLETQMQRLGVKIVETKAADLAATSVKDFGQYFDRVLLDAPCTGLGVLRRNPDAKWKRTKNDIQRMAAQQKKLLNAAANLVKPGGIIVFAVCSCETEENDDIVKHFLDKRKDFIMDSADMNRLKTYPDITGNTIEMDGFFAARLRRKNKKPS